jgi:GTP-binding protein LepA
VDSWNATWNYSRASGKRVNMTVITTALTFPTMPLPKEPNTILIVNNPSDLPEPSRLDHVEEPFIKATIITKSDYVGM